MKLFYMPGACSLATHIILEEIGQPFALEKTDPLEGTTETGMNFAGINPKGYVPALQADDDGVITESPAILQYLADRNPGLELAPANGTLERVRLQEMLSFITSELHKGYSPFFPDPELDFEIRAKAEKKLFRALDFLEAHLEDGRAFLLGGRFGAADAYAFVVLNWSEFAKIELARWPATLKFREGLRTRPSVVAAMTAEGLVTQEAAA